MKIPDLLTSEMIQYCKAAEPNEACGFVVLMDGKRQFIPCENIAADPENYFEISPDDWLNAQLKGEVVVVVHSHPNGEKVLSSADRQKEHQSSREKEYMMVIETVNFIYLLMQLP